MTLTYVGRLEPERLDREALALEPQGPDDTEPPLLLEPNYLLSSRSAWYPQNIVSDYARARIRVRVPPSYTVVASGRATPGDVSLAGHPIAHVQPRHFAADFLQADHVDRIRGQPLVPARLRADPRGHVPG